MGVKKKRPKSPRVTSEDTNAWLFGPPEGGSWFGPLLLYIDSGRALGREVFCFV